MNDPLDLAEDMADRLDRLERQLAEVERQLADAEAARQHQPVRAEVGGGVVTHFLRWLFR